MPSAASQEKATSLDVFFVTLAEEARRSGADDLTVYAYARVGYHRSLDLLRRNGPRWFTHYLLALTAQASRRSVAPRASPPATRRACST